MKLTSFVRNSASVIDQILSASSSEASQLTCVGSMDEREAIRHILVGSPSAVRQTIHRLHTLNYAENILWTPLVGVRDSVVITSKQGEAMSLLNRYL